MGRKVNASSGLDNVSRNPKKDKDVSLDAPRSGNEPMNPDELEFIQAVDAYKRHHDRPFPTLREFLAILKSLGYRKVVNR